MKSFARVSASMSILLGVAFLAWVSYDATSILNVIGPQTLLDEAAVAVLTISLGVFFLLLGIRVLRNVSGTAKAARPAH